MVRQTVWGAERTFQAEVAVKKLTEHENIKHGVGMGVSSVRPPFWLYSGKG